MVDNDVLLKHFPKVKKVSSSNTKMWSNHSVLSKGLTDL